MTICARTCETRGRFARRRDVGPVKEARANSKRIPVIERVPAAGAATPRPRSVSLQRARFYRGGIAARGVWHSYGIPIAHSPMAFPVPTTYIPLSKKKKKKKGREIYTCARKEEEDSDARTDELSREGGTARKERIGGKSREEDIGGAMWMTRIGDIVYIYIYRRHACCPLFTSNALCASFMAFYAEPRVKFMLILMS